MLYQFMMVYKTKRRTYRNNFRVLNVPGEGAECQSFTVISNDSLLVYDNKYYLQVYLDNYAYKIVDKQMIDNLHVNLLETDED